MRTRVDDIPTLTALRGFAAIAVVGHHFYGELGIYPHTHFFAQSYLWVDFFFVLSGFTMMHVYAADFRQAVSGAHFAAFMYARLLRIYPLHVFVLGLFLLVELALFTLRSLADPDTALPWFVQDGFLSEASDLSSLVGNLLLVQAWGLFADTTWNGVSWSISAEFLSYLVFPFICLGLARLSWSLQATAIVLTGAAGMAFMGAEHGFDVTHQLGFVRCFLEFGLGAALYVAYADARLRARLRPDGMLAGLFLLIAALLHVGALPALALPVLFLLVPVAACNDGWCRGILAGRVFQQLGRWSYSVYLLHIWVMNLTLALIQVVLGVPSWEDLGTHPVAPFLPPLLAGLVVAVASLAYQFIEMPVRRRLRSAIWPGRLTE